MLKESGMRLFSRAIQPEVLPPEANGGTNTSPTSCSHQGATNRGISVR